MKKHEAMEALRNAEKEMGVYGVGELINNTPMTKADYMAMVMDIEAEADKRMADEAEMAVFFAREERTRADIIADIERENAKYMALAETAPETAEEDWSYAI